MSSYAQPSGGGGSVYAGGASSTPTAPAKKSGGFLHSLAKYSGADLVGNLANDIGSAAVGTVRGAVPAATAFVHEGEAAAKHPIRFINDPNYNAPDFQALVSGVGQQYKDYYGPLFSGKFGQFGHNVYTHPLQPILDALTVASAGAGAGTKLGLLKEDRVPLVTRSPRAAATGKGPVVKDISSEQPFIRGRQRLAAKARNVGNAPRSRPGGVLGVGGELKAYGKAVQRQAERNALENIQGYRPYLQATKRLTENEWTALHIRALGIHPDDLKALWKGTPLERDLANPKVENLVLHPSGRMRRAEPEAAKLSTQGEQLLKGKGLLTDETAAARPDLTRRQAEETLGHPVKAIPGGPEPYYFPHTVEPVKGANPLHAVGGGKAVPRLPGTVKRNEGILALAGKLHLRGDVLGPEFLRRVKYVKYDEIHNALVRGAVRVTKQQLDEGYGGRLPAGWEYVREKASTRIPFTMRGESTQGAKLNELVPNAEDLHDSQLAKEGFSTTDLAQAHQSGGRFYIVPKATAKAATGEFTRSGDFTRAFIQKPLSVWRSVILGLRVGFLTNNLIGNSIMYAAKTGGEGALRNLFAAILETHGRETALKLLRNQATNPKLRTDLYREFFPEQMEGTFGRTQSPTATRLGQARSKTGGAFRSATSAIPKLTSKVAEEYPRRALIRHFIQKSPEFRKVYNALPKQTRKFETAARTILEGKGGAPFQRMISKQVNNALGDYLHLSPVERNVLRNTMPFYSWYRAIAVTTYHLAADTPLRANILGQIGRIGQEASQQQGPLPSFLQGSIPLGNGPGGTKRVLATQGLNPYATLAQLARGGLTDYSALGLNPFVQGPLDYVQHAKGNISPASLIASPLASLIQNLPLSTLIMPPGPSKLYPNRKGRIPQVLANVGVPVKEYNPAVAAQYAQEGR